ncbi:DUF4349 domain-containing protein [Planosporangium flavigriseum]|uniref:DUF4349 domain-containing protein n=1 Tax=Planosporangium flavigriseum TaxID=373681 RepID=A0A8J3PJU4_9ACTN|nr:DUF4349 domain-containing protein [Planosporangium flavigriseum]NJC63485.1 DUF4349 domain-containing protein [Planosporangium flavigriseum]GIG72182.1 hypothetical protein Pfl04_05860 [Planosporangium flavigriseum]
MSVIRPSGRFAATTLACTSMAMIVAGCGASDSSTKSSSAPATRQDAAQGKSEAGPATARGGGPDGKADSGIPKQVPVDSRALIFTGTVTIRVPDVGRAASDVSALATAAGGFIGGDDRTSDQDRSQARLTLRVPSARFTEVVSGISKLGRNGKDESRQLSTQDVTDEVTDVDARIATGQASVNRVRELLARAQNISEIVSLESELARREADLESLKSRKRKLDDLTAMSAVTAVLLGPQAAVTNKPETGFLAGLKAGWHAFTASMQVLLTVLGALLPFLLGAALPALAVVWALRRRRRPRPSRPDSEPTAPASPAPAATE